MNWIPPDIVKRVILPFLSIQDVLRLSKTFKQFSLDYSDWEYLSKRDYNVTGALYTYKEYHTSKYRKPNDCSSAEIVKPDYTCIKWTLVILIIIF